MSIDRPLRPPRPLAGRRVVVTHAQGARDTVAAQLRTLGADVTSCESIRFAFAAPDARTPLDGCLRRLVEYDWLVFTSATAVRAVAERPGFAPPAAGRPRVAVVGAATAAACGAAGLAVDVVAAGGTARDLVAALTDPAASGKGDGDIADRVDEQGAIGGGAKAASPPGAPSALFPRADIARTELPDGLRAAGWRIDSVEAYRTEPVPPRAAVVDALAAGVDAVAFASPSAVRALFDGLNGAAGRGLARAALVCIGPTTAAAVVAVGLSVAAVAAEASAEGLAAAVVGVLDTGEPE